MKKIGLIGYGCVAQGFHQLLDQSNIPAQVTRVCVKDPNKSRSIASELLTTDLDAVLDDPSIDLVIELISDAEVAWEIAQKCEVLQLPLISANKKMIAEHLNVILDFDIPFYYEGAVAGSIPVIQNLDHYFRFTEIQSLEAILNGSSNYILTRMLNQRLSFYAALEEAQEKGFAEADPTLDISGRDAANKLAILAHHAFGQTVNVNNIATENLKDLSRDFLLDTHFQEKKVKQIARIVPSNGQLEVSVKLEAIDNTHPLYVVDHEYNAILLKARDIGDQLLYGKGAGSLPTGLAVLNDLYALLKSSGYTYEINTERKVA